MIGMGGTLTCTLLKAKYNDIFYKLKRLCILLRSFSTIREKQLSSFRISFYLHVLDLSIIDVSLKGFRS